MIARLLRPLRRAVLVGVVVPAAIAGCGSAGGSGDGLLDQRAAARVTLRSAEIAGLGRVLVDGRGHTLYLFPPDAGQRVSCTGPCAGIWPPLAVRSEDAVAAGAGISAKRIATLPDPNTGARIVTYAGHPLYRYAGDLEPGVAHGQALVNSGGPWYAITPAGEPVVSDPAVSP